MTERNYEPRDIPAKGAALTIAGFLTFLLVAGGFVALVLAWASGGRGSPLPTSAANPPPPRLQVDALTDRKRIETAAKARLKGDANHPSIEEAMRIVAAQGWHDHANAPSTPETARAHTGAGP